MPLPTQFRVLWLQALSCGLVLAAAASLAPAQPGATEHLTKDPDFKPIFNGSNLDGWVNINTAPSTWQVKEGVIVCSGKPTGLLRTQRSFENFILEFEWKHLSAEGNGGLFVCSDALPVRGQPFTRAIEVQVMLGGEGDWYTSDGDIFPIHGATMVPENPRPKGGSRAFPTEKRMKPAGEWNHYRVEVNNGDISLAVNGKVVTRGRKLSPRIGYICLESEGSELHFRNLKVKDLPASGGSMDPAADRIEMSTDFKPLFTGVDFAGWKHTDKHKDHWEVDDWTIDFDGQSEDLWSEQSYKDFILIADWRWTGKAVDNDLPVILPNGDQARTDDGKPKTQKTPEAGDSGIYLRGSSKSQVNMWCWPVGSGEVYGYRTDAGMSPEVRAGVTPKLNADSKIGDWNRFVITMKGDRLTVVLNGKTVIDKAQLPGVAESGPIALQKHGSPIQFGNLYIKELKGD
ncbi:MAG: DUF1080 domain-containing protein [Phycisphaerales bacterium]|nr:DUF1080 domain-containing protein [Phycisphaerales bacterium]